MHRGCALLRSSTTELYNVESHGLSNKTTTAHYVKASLITDTSAKPDIIYIGRFLGSRTTELHTAIKLS